MTSGVATLRGRHGATAATDRRRYPPNTGHPPVLVDTLRLRGPVGAAALDSLPVQRRATSGGRATSSGAEVKLQPGVTLSVDDWRHGLEAVLEFSAPRLHYGANDRGATLEHTHEMAAQLYEEAATHVDWLCEVDQLQLMRLDLVRDFQVPAWAARGHLTALAQIPAARARTETYTGLGSNMVKSLYRKTDRWHARLYDRSASTSGAPLEGTTVRYELQLRSRSLNDRGLRQLSDLNEAHGAQLLRQYFDRCRFGVGVGPVLDKWAQALSGCELSSLARRGLLGQLVCDAIDERWGAVRDDRDRTASKHRQKAAGLGLMPGDLTSGAVHAGAYVRRLDYASGLLVA